jgi:uncharacterized protein YecE (DUF72 family)
MKFGGVENVEGLDLSLPEDHPETKRVLGNNKEPLNTVSVGCAKWNKQDLKGFYPRGTKDELQYYAREFNSIELNATFYNLYDENQIATWRDKTPDNFKFFPKIPRYVSHLKRLNDYGTYLEDYFRGIVAFKEKLGMLFLQLHNNFGPKEENLRRLTAFIEDFPTELSLGVELRHTDWFNNEEASTTLYNLLETKQMSNIIVDTAGRRDLMHMRLTSPDVFVRYVGANHETDYTRLDEWVDRLVEWKKLGMRNLYFFIHQNLEKESPLLSAYFIKSLNEAIGTDIKTPSLPDDKQGKLGL